MLDSDEIAPERLRPLSRIEFDQLAEMGAFENERVELLRGAIVVMTPPDPPHSHAVMWMQDLLARYLGERVMVSCQNPLAISDYSEPQPDIAVLPRRDYSAHHPTWAHLLVEVADSSLRKDRRVKREIYAEGGVPEYWIVNLVERVVEVYREPVDGHYTREERIGPGGVLRPAEFPDVEIPVDTIIPPRA
jgi:Uma2 family endonuclease